MLVKITATLANGMPIIALYNPTPSTLDDVKALYAELVANGDYLNATVTLDRP